MKENKIRELLNAGKPTIGTRIVSQWPYMVEHVGASGNFDYIEFLAEYAPFTQYDLENIARACELSNMGSMIKVDFQNRAFVAQKAVASGFQAILFTDHATPEEFRESIRMIKPHEPVSGGRFGYPNRRYIGNQPYIPQKDHIKRLNDIVICFMIEKKETMDKIEEICSIPGIDMLQFGPSDYSMSMGMNKAESDEECKAAQKKMIEVALKNGIHPRCEVFGDPDQVKYYLDLGVRDVCFGDEVNTFNTFVRKDGSYMRGLIDGLK
ncbi:MAG: aldolase/citrate lyase family protein [Atribacterota bacterium]|nr:aldolase/citrate lyase family protein [Atribacterota bacterium]